MRRAAGDVAGKTVTAQVRQVARHLGYVAGNWRVHEAWCVDELRGRSAAWQEREATVSARGRSVLTGYVAAVLLLLAELDRHVAALEAEVSN